MVVVTNEEEVEVEEESSIDGRKPVLVVFRG